MTTTEVTTGDKVAVDGSMAWTGRVEYIRDGWAGVRQGRRLDEVQVERCRRMR